MKYLLLILLIFSTTAKALSVPFFDAILQPNQSIQANYNFGPYSVLFCWDPSLQSAGNLNWSFQGKQYNTPIPVNLTISSQFTGFPADPAGTITILNNTGSPLDVSCQFAF